MLPQIIRFGIVGLVVNSCLYVFYLFLVWSGLTITKAATVAFLCGIALSYVSHRKFTFSDAQSTLGRKIKFGALYVTAYGLQIGLLNLLVALGLRHEFSQLIATGVVAAFLFINQKLLIFTEPTHETTSKS